MCKAHGPYWYSYTRVKDKVKSQYVGKRPRVKLRGVLIKMAKIS